MRHVLVLLALCVVAQALPFDGSKRLDRIALGSCNHASRPQPFWPEISRYDPQAFVWLGDITYADRNILRMVWLPGTNESMRAEFDTQRRKPDYQRLVASSQIVGVADDHDYGLNDADWRNPVKDLAQEIILDFLDEPADSPRRKQQGLNASYTWGPEGQRVKLILLDIRYHQNAAAQDLLGAAQWAWLEEELKNNDAQLTLIGSGIQIVTPNKYGAEGWKAFPKERYRLFELLARHCANTAVLLLSGDVHLAEFARTHVCLPSPEEASATVLPLWELTTSGLTHAWGTFHGTMPDWLGLPIAKVVMGKIITRGSRETLVGDTYMGLNWGALTIDWEGQRVRAEVRGLKETVALRFDLAFEDLKPRALRPGDDEAILKDCRAEVIRRDSPPRGRVSMITLWLGILSLLLAIASCVLYCGRACRRGTGKAAKQQRKKDV